MNISKIIKKIKLHKLLDKLECKNQKPLDENIMVSCPFHEDKKPSCGISKKTGQFNCFSCGESGSLITFIAKIKDITLSDAVRYLNKFAGISKESLIISGKTIYRQLKKMLIRKNKKTHKEDETEYSVELPLYLNDEYLPGIHYFDERGIDKYTLKKHNISFCTSGFYKNRAITPVYKPDGSLLTFEARDITGMADKKVLYPKNTKINRTLFNFDKAYHGAEIIIVEGMMDALYLDQRGFNVVSTFGAAVSEKQEELLSHYFKIAYISFDGDKAGRRATIRYGSNLELHLSVYVMTLKNNTDPDSYSTRQFKKLFDNAIPFQEYIDKKIIKKILE